MYELLNKIPKWIFLAVNVVLGFFVLIAHGGALLLVMSRVVPISLEYSKMIQTIAPFSLSIAALIIISSIIGFVRIGTRNIVLTFQASILFIAGICLYVWALNLFITGITHDNFTWTPGLLTCSIVYSLFLFIRFTLKENWKRHWIIRFIPIIGAIFVLPVDIGILIRLVVR